MRDAASRLPIVICGESMYSEVRISLDQTFAHLSSVNYRGRSSDGSREGRSTWLATLGNLKVSVLVAWKCRATTAEIVSGNVARGRR